jgi:hypothetical protein
MDSLLVDVASLGNVSLLQSNSRISTTKLQKKRQRIYKNGPRNTIFCDFRNIEIIIQNTWILFCATNRKAAASIPDGVIGFFR